MKTMKKKLFLSVALILGSVLSLHADGLQPHQLNDIKSVGEVAVSPGGQYVAYTLHVPRPISQGQGKAYNELHVFNLENQQRRALITGKVQIGSLGWVPGTEMITYRKSVAGDEGMQLFTISVDGTGKQQLTEFSRSIRSYGFIDKETLVFTALEPKPEKKKELLEKGFDLKIVEEDLRSIDLIRYDLKTGEHQKLTDGVAVFDFEVSPSGEKVAAAIAPRNTTDAYYMFKRVHILDAGTGEVLEKIENPGKLANMAWSPDSKRLAFRAAAKEADAVTGSLFVLEVGEGQSYDELENLVKGQELSVTDMEWQDNKTLLFASEESVHNTLRSINVKNNKQELLLEGGKVAFNNFYLQDDMIVFDGNRPTHPDEIYRFALQEDDPEMLTNHNPWLKEIEMARQEKVSYEARDGMRIDGVLIYPLHYEEGKEYPLITYIHGGPEASVQNGWLSRYSRWGQFAAAKDFFVFYPNYRASSGRGVDFTMAGFGDLLGKEYEDVLDGIDYLVEEGKVDPERVGIGGGSYGGYFAAWSATKFTERFAASVVFVGVTNQVSKRNITDIPWEDYLVHWGFWTHEDYDKVWEASPVKYAHQSKTPTLILHGEEDPRIPVTQGEELYRAMKMHGEAPVRFVVYPGEGHGNRKNTNQYDYLLRTLNWFEFYLKGDQPNNKMPEKYPEYEGVE
ncbi:MAG: S9 family peptidase [Bacteroidales bacterium]|nr:S9 family peptidase [Bacteroidales bacterium]